jgi:uncharacterized membrane protein
MASHLFKKRLIWGMVIAIGMVIVIVGSTLGSSALVATAATQPFYVVMDLETLGGSSSSARDINNTGQVVGGTYPSSALIVLPVGQGKKIDLGNFWRQEQLCLASTMQVRWLVEHIPVVMVLVQPCGTRVTR